VKPAAAIKFSLDSSIPPLEGLSLNISLGKKQNIKQHNILHTLKSINGND